MNIWQILGIVAGLGAFGGLVNCAISEEFKMPRWDAKSRAWRPGWLGNLLVGAAAAVVNWGLYGPMASADVLQASAVSIPLPLAQVVMSIVIGLGGGRFLTLVAQKQSERASKELLTKSLQDMLSKTKSDS